MQYLLANQSEPDSKMILRAAGYVGAIYWALISTCHELGISFDETAAKVKEKFSFEEDETQKNMQLYW